MGAAFVARVVQLFLKSVRPEGMYAAIVSGDEPHIALERRRVTGGIEVEVRPGRRANQGVVVPRPSASIGVASLVGISEHVCRQEHAAEAPAGPQFLERLAVIVHGIQIGQQLIQVRVRSEVWQAFVGENAPFWMSTAPGARRPSEDAARNIMAILWRTSAASSTSIHWVRRRHEAPSVWTATRIRDIGSLQTKKRAALGGPLNRRIQ